jgi:hypothetical protein
MICCTYEEWWFRADGGREARSVIDVISLADTGILMLMATRLGLRSIEFEIPGGRWNLLKCCFGMQRLRNVFEVTKFPVIDECTSMGTLLKRSELGKSAVV